MLCTPLLLFFLNSHVCPCLPVCLYNQAVIDCFLISGKFKSNCRHHHRLSGQFLYWRVWCFELMDEWIDRWIDWWMIWYVDGLMVGLMYINRSMDVCIGDCFSPNPLYSEFWSLAGLTFGISFISDFFKSRENRSEFGSIWEGDSERAWTQFENIDKAFSIAGLCEMHKAGWIRLDVHFESNRRDLKAARGCWSDYIINKLLSF